MIPAAIKEWVKGYVARLVRRATLAATSASGADQMNGYEVDPTDPDYQLPVRRYQHYGFRSRPAVGAEVICVAPEGGTSQRVSIASEVPGTGPSAQEEGEVELYAQFGQRLTYDKEGGATLVVPSGATIYIDKNGAVVVKPKPGQTVSLGDDVAGNLDYVVLFTALKSYLEGHTHQPGSFAAGMTAVSGISGPANEAFTAHSSNVLAKK